MANILAIVSLLLVAVTVVANSWQAHEVARQTSILANTNRALLAHQVESEGNQITQLFLQYPELYRYFVDNVAAPQEGPTRRQVHVIAKLIVDHMCLVIQSETLFNEEYRNAWRAYFQDIAASSPAIREYWQARHNWYEAAMKDMMDGIITVTGPVAAHQNIRKGSVK
jgi:hypothetical protein